MLLIKLLDRRQNSFLVQELVNELVCGLDELVLVHLLMTCLLEVQAFEIRAEMAEHALHVDEEELLLALLVGDFAALAHL